MRPTSGLTGSPGTWQVRPGLPDPGPAPGGLLAGAGRHLGRLPHGGPAAHPDRLGRGSRPVGGADRAVDRPRRRGPAAAGGPVGNRRGRAGRVPRAGGRAGGSVFAASGRLILGWFARAERGLAMGIRQSAQPLGVAIAAVTLPTLGARRLSAPLLFLAVFWLVAAAGEQRAASP